MANWRDDDFDAALNQRSGVEIRGHLFEPADILASRRDAYEDELDTWRHEQRQAFIARVRDEFPSPIALRFGRYVNVRKAKDKLRHLRDTWHGLITSVASMAVAEVRAGKIDASAGRVDHGKQLLLHNLRDQIDVITKLHDAGVGVPVFAAIDGLTRFVACIDKLRDERNVFAHGEEPNEQRSQELLAQCEPLVFEALERASFLAHVVVFKYVEDDEDGEAIIVRPFRGRLTEDELEALTLPDASCTRIRGRPHSHDHVWYLVPGEEPVLLSPLIRWCPASKGQGKYLSYLDAVKSEGGAKVFHYRIYGDAEPYQKKGKQLERDWESLRKPFRVPPTPSRNELQKAAAKARKSVSKDAPRSS